MNEDLEDSKLAGGWGGDHLKDRVSVAVDEDGASEGVAVSEDHFEDTSGQLLRKKQPAKDQQDHGHLKDGATVAMDEDRLEDSSRKIQISKAATEMQQDAD